MIVLLDAEDCTIAFSFIWTKHRNVTDRQTDRQPWQPLSALQATRTRC